MTNVFLKTWALFLGFAIISLAHGLQGTLLGVRAVFEGFSIISTGFIVAGYYVGYLSGSIIIPILLKMRVKLSVVTVVKSILKINNKE